MFRSDRELLALSHVTSPHPLPGKARPALETLELGGGRVPLPARSVLSNQAKEEVLVHASNGRPVAKHERRPINGQLIYMGPMFNVLSCSHRIRVFYPAIHLPFCMPPRRLRIFVFVLLQRIVR